VGGGEAGRGLGLLGGSPVPLCVQPAGVRAELGDLHPPAARPAGLPGPAALLGPQGPEAAEGRAPTAGLLNHSGGGG